jgi:hypothetical protein
MNISRVNLFFDWIEKKSRSKYYVVYLTSLLVILCLFFVTPNYNKWIHDLNAPPVILTDSISRSQLVDNLKYNWDVVMMKSRNLLDPLTSIDQTTSPRNTVFRLTVPLVIKVFGLSPLTTYIVQFLLGSLLISLFYKLSNRILKNAVAATFLTAGLVFTYFGRACFISMGFDGWDYLLLILTMSFKKPVTVFFFATLTAWTDERAVIALAIPFVFHQIDSGKFNFRNLLAIRSPNYGLISAVIGYILLRSFLTFQYNMHLSSGSITSLSYAERQFLGGFLQAGIWSFLEGFWLLSFFVFGYAISKKHYTILFMVFLPVLILGFGACFVDITRSGSFLVPVVFVFISYLRHFITQKDLNVILSICMVITVIYPAYYIAGGFNLNPSLYFLFL